MNAFGIGWTLEQERDRVQIDETNTEAASICTEENGANALEYDDDDHPENYPFHGGNRSVRVTCRSAKEAGKCSAKQAGVHGIPGDRLTASQPAVI